MYFERGKKMENEKKDVVKYDNNFNFTNLSQLSKLEFDILATCLSQIQASKTLRVEISFDELREKGFFFERNIRRSDIIPKLKPLGDKMVDIKFRVYSEKEYRIMPIFIDFLADLKKEKITIEMNKIFSKYFFDIPEKIGFSQFELKAIVFLKSKYSQILFRHLLENFTGKWSVSFFYFRKTLGFPDSYKTGEIKKTLDRIIPELEATGYFSDIEYDWTYSRRQGRPIKDIIFNYKVNQYKAAERAGQTTIADYDYTTQTEPKTQLEVDISDPLRPVAVEKTVEIERKCPYCGEGKIISRTATGDKNKGKRYEKCEFNDRQEGCCRYFKWIDEN